MERKRADIQESDRVRTAKANIHSLDATTLPNFSRHESNRIDLTEGADDYFLRSFVGNTGRPDF